VSPKPANILLVVGVWGDVTHEDARRSADILAEVLQSRKANVEIVDRGDGEDAVLNRLRAKPRVDSVVFCSRGLADMARRVRLYREFRDTSVFVHTALVPDEEVVFVSKALDPDTCADIFING